VWPMNGADVAATCRIYDGVSTEVARFVSGRWSCSCDEAGGCRLTLHGQGISGGDLVPAYFCIRLIAFLSFMTW